MLLMSIPLAAAIVYFYQLTSDVACSMASTT